MKKLIFTFAILLSLLPVAALAQTSSGSGCVNGRNNDGTACFTGPAISTPANAAGDAASNNSGQGNSSVGGSGSSQSSVSNTAQTYSQTAPAAAATNANNPQTVTNPDPAFSAGGGVTGVPSPNQVQLTLPNNATPPAASPCPAGGTLNANGSCNLGYVPLEPIPGLTTNINLTNGSGLGPIIDAVYRIMITVGALLAVLSLTFGGIQYMTSMSPTLKNAGITRARAALTGILLIAATWLILHTINPQLLNFSLNPCGGGTTATCNTGVNSAGITPGFSATATGDTVQQNLGDPTKGNTSDPNGFSSLSTLQGYAVTQALGCAGYNIACLGAQQYITYDPSQINTPAVQQAITNYNSNCSGSANLWVGNVKTIDGSTVGSPGQTALVCAGPLQ